MQIITILTCFRFLLTRVILGLRDFIFLEQPASLELFICFTTNVIKHSLMYSCLIKRDLILFFLLFSIINFAARLFKIQLNTQEILEIQLRIYLYWMIGLYFFVNESMLKTKLLKIPFFIIFLCSILLIYTSPFVSFQFDRQVMLA